MSCDKGENRISVVINTYNAELHLRRVLDAVVGFDETVICDMESTDATLDIAREYGCRIVTFPKENHKIVEPARMLAIQSASYKWVLVVDADEIIPLALRDYLYMRIAEPSCPQGLYIARQGMFMSQPMNLSYPDYQLRFFVREGTVWPPYVHSIPSVQGRVERIPRGRHDLAMIHLANDTVYGILKKTNEYSDNDAVKKASRNFGLAALVYRPAFKFFKSYILCGGWRDGTAGLIKAGLNSFYQFVVVAKMIEKRRNEDNVGRHE